MIHIPFITFVLPLLLLGFGLFIASSIKPKQSASNRAQLLMNLIKESLSNFASRAVWSMVQMVIYTIIVLGGFAFWMKTGFFWEQLWATLLGGTLIIIATVFNLNFIPKMINRIIEDNKVYLQVGAPTLFRTGAVTTFILMGFASFGWVLTSVLWGPNSIIGYTCGLILTSVFLRVGGNLYKTSATLTDDHIRHFEKELPSYDARNVASLLNISGQLIGNLLGYGTDILGSFMIAFVAAFLSLNGLVNTIGSESIALFFILLLSISLIAALCTYFVTVWRLKSKRYQNALLEGLYAALIVSGLGFYWVLTQSIFSSFYAQPGRAFALYLMGLVGASLIAFSSEYFTSSLFKPAKNIAKDTQHRSVIMLLNCLGLGLRSNGLFIFYFMAIVFGSLALGGLKGLTLATLGMLSTATSIIMVSSFNPLASTTKRIVSYSEENCSEKNLSALSRLGKTTVALGNGLTSSASIFAALTLFITLLSVKYGHSSAYLSFSMNTFIGLVIGLTLPYISSGFLMKSLVTLTLKSTQEVYRQFRDIPYLIENKAKPDILKASDKTTTQSLDAMIIPGLLMALVPISLAFLFGVPIAIGCGIGVFLTTLNQTFYWATTGDVAHSAFSIMREGRFGGPESPAFPAINSTENMGLVFKDVLSPSLNIFLKVVAIITGLLVVILN